MNTNDYVNGKGPLEQEYVRLTGKSHMRIGRRLRKRYAGLSREEIAERLLKKAGLHRRSTLLNSDQQITVTHSFELRPGRVAKLEVPSDLSSDETTKLAKLIELLGPAN